MCWTALHSTTTPFCYTGGGQRVCIQTRCNGPMCESVPLLLCVLTQPSRPDESHSLGLPLLMWHKCRSAPAANMVMTHYAPERPVPGKCLEIIALYRGQKLQWMPLPRHWDFRSSKTRNSEPAGFGLEPGIRQRQTRHSAKGNYINSTALLEAQRNSLVVFRNH